MNPVVRTHTALRPTIGYLGGSMVVEQPWQAGLLDAAHAQNLNLIIFAGGALESPNRFDAQRSRIFELAGQQNVDGLIVGSDFLGHYAGVEKIRQFCEQYRPIPLVKYEPLVEGFPTLLFDFYQGMYDLISHLIETHRLTKIGYITGPEQSRSIRDRFQGYRDALEAHSIAYDARLVVTSPIAIPSGEDAVHGFLEERGLRPGKEIEAIVGFYDFVAADVQKALQRRGIAVPDVIAVAGFDDDEVAFAANPRLTTVRLPFYEIGRWGVDTLAAMLRGSIPPKVTTLSASLVVRHSCGCQAVDGLRALSPASVGEQGIDLPQAPLGARRNAILAHLLTTSGIRNIPRFQQDIEALLDLFLEESGLAARQDVSPDFAEALAAILGRMGSIHYNVEMVHTMLAVLQREFVAEFHLADAQLRVRDLFQQARIVASDVVERFLIAEKNQIVYLDSLLHEINQEMATTLTVQDLVEVLARYLPILGIPACYLSLYERPEEVTGFARLLFAHGRGGRVGLPGNGRVFDARQLVPRELRDFAQPAALVVLPLFHREEQMGFVVFEIGPRYGGVYEALREQISSTLKRIQLHSSVVEARRKAEEANALKSRFLSTVTHELRAPLSMLVSLSAMLLEDAQGSRLPMPEEYRQDIEVIHATGQHLDRLVLDVLDLGRSQLGQLRLELKPLDLAALLEDVARVGERMAQEKLLAWRAHIPSALPVVVGDRTRLQQILLNLIGNATKFTLHGEVSLLVTVGDREITVAVSDTGLGIPEKDQATIFDEFYQSERTSARGYGGMGLGLAITRRLVELHGGKLNLISSGEEGSGTTFYFTLPIRGDAMPVDEEIDQIAPDANVLVIARHKEDAEHLAGYLVRQGFRVRAAAVDADPQWLDRVLAEPCDAIVVNCEPSTPWSSELLQAVQANPAKRKLPLLFCNLQPDANRGAFLDLSVLSKPLGLDALAQVLKQHGFASVPEAGHMPAILVVDDESETLRLHTQFIRDHMAGFRVLEASNGRQALEMMLRAPPDLVLLDLMMPEIDGFGVLEAMQGHTGLRTVPVIIMTGQVLPEEVMLRLNRCVAGILGKGLFTVEETLKQVEAALARDKRLGNEPQRIARRALGFIHTHYAEAISRGDIAGQIGVNERYLTHCFRQEVGITPMDYLNRYRVNVARQLLATGTMSITEVGLEVGFSSSAHFSRVFHQHTGTSPREFLRGRA